MISFTKVAIVDDKQPNRVSLNERLSAAHEFEVVFMAVNGEDFMDKMKSCPKNNILSLYKFGSLVFCTRGLLFWHSDPVQKGPSPKKP